MKTKTILVIAVLYLLTAPKHNIFGQSTPNVIYIMADDLGYGDLGCYGQQLIQTPSIDSLAKLGCRFTQMYSGSTVCAPSRSVLMTGQHTGHTTVRGNKKLPLPDADTTVAELFKQKGYTTACIGKWGIGDRGTTGHPNLQGFDHFFGYLDQVHAHTYYTDSLIRNYETILLDGQTYSHDLLTAEAMEFIGRNHDTNFFLYLPYTIPHTKFQVPGLGQYENMVGWSEDQKIQAAMISRMDGDVGRIMDTLKTLGISDSTLVIFTSDNGPHGQSNTNAFFNANGPLNGRKRDLYEGGIRVPFVAVWPGKIPKGSTSDYAGAFWDFLPTCAEILKVSPPASIDGISYLPVLLKPETKTKHEYLYWEFHEQNGKQALRMGDWKAVRLNVYNNPDNPLELYNLANDLAETNNLAEHYPEIVNMIDFKIKNERTHNATFDFTYGNPDITELEIQTLTGLNLVAPNDTAYINYQVTPAKVTNRITNWQVMDNTSGASGTINQWGQLIVGADTGTFKLVATSVSNPSVTDTLLVRVSSRTAISTNLAMRQGANNAIASASIAIAGAPIKKAGFCYGTESIPDFSDIVKETTVNGKHFSDTLKGLPEDVEIFIRAFLITTIDTNFGNTVSITINNPDLGHLKENLLLYLPLDANSNDYSPFNRTVSKNGTLTFESEGKMANCAGFDGATSYLQTETMLINPATTDFTFCAWLYPRENTDNNLVLQQEDGSGKGRSILYITGSTFSSFLGGTGNSSSATCQLNEWTHVAIVGRQNQIKFVINGQEEQFVNVAIEAADGELNIGRAKTGSQDNRNWNGKMDEVYLFNKALKETEISALMVIGISNSKSTNQAANKVFIFPNPLGASKNIHIQHYLNNEGTAIVTLHTLSGQMVYKQQLVFNNGQGSLNYRPTQGIYVLTLQFKGSTATRKVIVE